MISVLSPTSVDLIYNPVKSNLIQIADIKMKTVNETGTNCLSFVNTYMT